MLIELGYQLSIHACSGNYLGNIFLLFFLSFLDFLVKRPDGSSWCPNSMVDSFGRPFSLSGRACFCDLLRGTTSIRHLSSVRTVNPVGLYHFPPRAAAALCHFFCFFCRLVNFFCAFYAYFSSARVLFAIYLHPRYVFIPFYWFILSFYA
jgi:hypothetical protein